MRPYLIGIAGPSCAGKSYLSKHMAQQLDAALVHMDSYYAELSHLSIVQRAHHNFDAPEAFDADIFIEQVRQISRGVAIDKPVYDFATHSRKTEVEHVEPKQYVIVEGILSLYWEDIRKLLGTKVYVDLGLEKCLERRIERDIRERGRTRESVMEQYKTTVAPMAKRYVQPTREYADIVVTGNDDISHEVDLVMRHIREHEAAWVIEASQ